VQKTKARFKEVIENEIKTLKSVKIQFALNVRFLITRNAVKEQMKYYFKQRVSDF